MMFVSKPQHSNSPVFPHHSNAKPPSKCQHVKAPSSNNFGWFSVHQHPKCSACILRTLETSWGHLTSAARWRFSGFPWFSYGGWGDGGTGCPHSTVLMLNPKVGEMVSTGSPLNLGRLEKNANLRILEGKIPKNKIMKTLKLIQKDDKTAMWSHFDDLPQVAASSRLLSCLCAGHTCIPATFNERFRSNLMRIKQINK